MHYKRNNGQKCYCGLLVKNMYFITLAEKKIGGQSTKMILAEIGLVITGSNIKVT